MPKKPSASDAASTPSEESSQHIWLAGLGAMAKAQSQGTKAFEALIADGLSFQRKTQMAAQEKITAATAQLSHLAKDFGEQSTGRIDRLEHLFEDRVARALPRLGIPSIADLEALSQRVARLEAQLAKATQSAKATAAPKATKTAASTKVTAPAAAKKTR
jgi:poly(hydroxyalkanoate) granule-associated protein